ncbi:GGDEF domain-containing protein [Paenibacillus sp. YPG26]|uniref:GGDEF domain-containing protein n=1 Tax=Paenibacillus sp. YPG26 TaxID=2878915 RepID=UPI00203BA1D5|nr:GGDEF domain-containing protein [Paenibacillus sp. YPG26]USB32984.1 GGDEF domain-containing protein [Paenibacillus sp. YPG26]
MISQIGEIAEVIPHVYVDTKCEEVDQIFKSNPKLQGVVVQSGSQPVALVMRARFYQRIGTLYGYNLYMGRPVELVMNQSPLIVDYSENITEVSKLAMAREEEELYDYVIVTTGGQFHGVVSIRNLLLSFAEIRATIASFLNPLTGLPGNLTIDERLKLSLTQETFSVLYFDLDHFKAYNDIYGFKEGDKLIQATASILRRNVSQPDYFVGHIGGDDFIAILNDFAYEEVCNSVIRQFDHTIAAFYSKEDLERQYVVSENRFGQVETIPLVSISIAVVTNEFRQFSSIEEIVSESARIKKICKKHKLSCYYTNIEKQVNLI